MTNETDTTADATTAVDEGTEIAVGDRYRLPDDGTVFEVVGITDEVVDVVQYAASGEVQAEYTTTIEEFRNDIADLVE